MINNFMRHKKVILLTKSESMLKGKNKNREDSLLDLLADTEM